MPTTLSETHSPGLSPIAEPERIHTLDILRAVALFGVFLMNVQYFTHPLETIGRANEPELYDVKAERLQTAVPDSQAPTQDLSSCR